MTTSTRERQPVTSVETASNLSNGDMQELCDATEAAIEDGGGFGWLTIPPRKPFEDYSNGVLLIPERELIVGRIDGVIAASCQLVRPPRNNEAQVSSPADHILCHAMGTRSRPCATDACRSRGLARGRGFRTINLDVRSTQITRSGVMKRQAISIWARIRNTRSS